MSVVLTLNLSSPSNTYAVNPIIALEGINLGVNILKEVGDKVKDAIGSKKKKKKYKSTNNRFICLNPKQNSSYLLIEKFNHRNYNYEICVDDQSDKKLYKELVYWSTKKEISIDAAYNIFFRNNHWFRSNLFEKKLAIADQLKENKDNLNSSNFKKITTELMGTNSKNFQGHTWNGYVVSQKYYCQEAIKAGMQSWGPDLFDKKGCNKKDWRDEFQLLNLKE